MDSDMGLGEPEVRMGCPWPDIRKDEDADSSDKSDLASKCDLEDDGLWESIGKVIITTVHYLGGCI